MSWLGVFGMGFSLVGSGVSLFHVRSVVLLTVVVSLGNVPFPPLVGIRESPEFHDLMRMNKGHWPRCLLWHGWLPMLSAVNGASPWTASASEGAGCLVEVALGQYSPRLLDEWSPSDEFDAVQAASSMSDHTNVWTDGSFVLDRVTGVSSSGAFFFFAHQSDDCWCTRSWDGIRADDNVSSCRGFFSVPGNLQSVQRAEMW